jgi:hypothetical protein
VVVLSRFSLIAAVAPPPAAFEMPATAARVHAKVAPAVDDVAVYAVEALSQIVLAAALVITAVGLTVTTRLKGVPGHPPAAGVITYVTLTGAVEVLSRFSFMAAVAPPPAAFAIPATTARVHVKVAPVVDDVAVYAVDALSQMVLAAALVTTAVG